MLEVGELLALRMREALIYALFWVWSSSLGLEMGRAKPALGRAGAGLLGRLGHENVEP